ISSVALRTEIRELAGSMDRLRAERKRKPSLKEASDVSLESYFLDTLPTEEEQAAPINVAVPGWWPVLATFTALGFLLLFVLLYPLHHSARLAEWNGDGNSWFVRTLEPEDEGVIMHQDGLTYLRNNDLDGLGILNGAIEARQGDYPAAQLNLATGLYNYYAQLYNDTTLVLTNVNDPAYVHMADRLFNLRKDYSIDAYDANLPARVNLNHLQGLLSYHLLEDPGNNSPISDVLYFPELEEAGYFDTLSFRPNLQTLVDGREVPPLGPAQTVGQDGPEQRSAGQTVIGDDGRPLVVYTPANTPNVPFQITVLDNATRETVAGASVGVYYYGELFGPEYTSGQDGNVKVALPLDLVNTEILVLADNYGQKRWPARNKGDQNRWICQMDPLPGQPTSVNIDDVILFPPPAVEQESITYGTGDLADILRRGGNSMLDNPRFNPNRENVAILTQLRKDLGVQHTELLAARDALLVACLTPTPVRVTIQADVPVRRKSASPTVNLAEYVRRAFLNDSEIAQCIEAGTVTITAEQRELDWPQDATGLDLSIDNWRVRYDTRVVISFE
ncbi:MAG: hypothetical protein AAFZ52_16405, partial [Bacteroidota bacterium]